MYQTLFYGNVKTYDENENDLSWEKTKISAFGKSFYVFLAVTGDKTIIKPTMDRHWCPWACCQNSEKYGYHQLEYEDLFGFSEHCGNFDQNKMIDITDKINKSILIN